jgi:CheY-like chemotaxis protein
MKEFSNEKDIFQLQCVIEESITNLQLHEEYKAVQLRRVDDLAEPLTLIGNKQALKEVLRLLMTTAAAYTGATSIVISVKQLLETEKEVLLEFAVTDNGGKLSDEGEETQIAYHRHLSEARALLERHGGKAEINSLQGVGTTFKFLLKYLKQTGPANNTASEKKLNGKKILVADDNELNQRMIEHLLKREGVKVDIANDGREALDLYERNDDYDLVLLDLQMPHVDGFQAANYIRRKLNSHTPIVALTAGFYPDADTRCMEVGFNGFYPDADTRCMEVGFNQCIRKPLKPNDLLNTLYEFLMDETEVGMTNK